MHTDFEGVEKYIRSLPALTLEGVVDKQELKPFIYNLLDKYTHYRYTFEAEKIFNAPVRIGKWSRRTITDIYRLCLTYVSEDLALLDVLDILFEMLKANTICSYVCNNIHKRVWWIDIYFRSRDGHFGGYNAYDEYDLDYTELMLKHNRTLNRDFLSAHEILPSQLIKYK